MSLCDIGAVTVAQYPVKAEGKHILKELYREALDLPDDGNTLIEELLDKLVTWRYGLYYRNVNRQINRSAARGETAPYTTGYYFKGDALGNAKPADVESCGHRLKKTAASMNKTANFMLDAANEFDGDNDVKCDGFLDMRLNDDDLSSMYMNADEH